MRLLGSLLLLASSFRLSLCGHHHHPTKEGFELNPVLRMTDQKETRVAIIGAGAAGSSAAYHLRDYAQASGQNVRITMFERSHYVGGRTTTVNAWDYPAEPVELGGSIFVKVNRILVSAAEKFNLSTDNFRGDLADDEADRPFLGIWNGKEFVLVQNQPGNWWETAKLLWRYGLAPIKTLRLMRAVVGTFLKMYDEPHFPWKSLSGVIDDLGLNKVTGVTGEQYLKANGIGESFAKEVIQASTRVNYAQNLPFIHGVETMVCMATDGAMAVKGGNWQIFDNMARYATPDVRLSANVTAVKRRADGSYVVHSGDKNQKETFDAVILAAPYQFAKIDFAGEESTFVPDEIPYVKLHVTLFASPHRLSPSAFNMKPGQKPPKVILTTLQESEKPGNATAGPGAAGFFSISTLRRASNPHSNPPWRSEYLYKIFSHVEADDAFLAKILGLPMPVDGGEAEPISKVDVSWVFRKVWHSYPVESPRVTFEELKLGERLWYTAGIESFISTMETSALVGKNVARLVANEIERNFKGEEDGTCMSGSAQLRNGDQQVLKAKL